MATPKADLKGWPKSQTRLVLIYPNGDIGTQMKATAFLLFALLMFIASIINPPIAYIATLAVFAAGAALSEMRPGILCSNVAGFLGRAQATTDDDEGEWQQYVLRRNGKGMNSGSTLFGLMSRLAQENADSVTYNWWEKDPVRRIFYSTAARTDADTTISFDDNASSPATDIWVFLTAGAVMLNERTGERIRIAATPTTTTITITRGIQGTAAAAVNDNDLWLLVTHAQASGSAPVRSAFAQPTAYNNYIQTFNKTASVDNAYKAGILRTDIDGPKMEQQLDALEQIANDIELAYFLGVKELSGTTYYTGGLKSAVDTASLTANALNGNGTAGVTLTAFDDWMQAIMTQGSDTKLFFGGPKSYAAITRYANSASGGYRTSDHSETVFGMNIETIKTPFGQLSLASHPLFKNISMLNDWGFVVDLQLIVQKVLEPLFFQEYEPTNGADSWQGQFRAKLGLKEKYPEAFGYCYDLSLITAG